ncbi:hypothetical protein RV12_GL002064 [Enterococcus quebecensis]|nr:hypothetical protein RV12_GL002064 [Enterococcus quebecensis]
MKIIRVHDFRKTNASLLFESGASIKNVSQRLGHKSTKITTDIYIKVTKAKQNKTAEKFSDYMAFLKPYSKPWWFIWNELKRCYY